MIEKACRSCHTLTSGNICPNCKTANLSDDWTGILIIVNPEGSKISEKLGINKPGRYAVKVR